MIAIIPIAGIKYACNLDNNQDLICLQSQIRNGLYILAISFNRDQICLRWNWDCIRFRRFIASIFGPHWKRLRAYIVRFGFEIANIFTPFYGQDCKHIWSRSLLSLQAYLVSVIKIIATISGPAIYQNNLVRSFSHVIFVQRVPLEISIPSTSFILFKRESFIFVLRAVLKLDKSAADIECSRTVESSSPNKMP